jgi:hypothetical protein
MRWSWRSRMACRSGRLRAGRVSRRRRCIPGRVAGEPPGWRSGGRWPVCLIARVGRTVRRECCRQGCRSGSARSGVAPVTDRPIAGRLGLAHATVWKALRRHGCSRVERPPRERGGVGLPPGCHCLLHRCSILRGEIADRERGSQTVLQDRADFSRHVSRGIVFRRSCAAAVVATQDPTVDSARAETGPRP